MEATFENSVNVLVKAYLNDTLTRLNSCACAVGNLMQAAGVSFPIEWGAYVRNHYMGEEEKALSQIAATGYTIEQIRSIEMAFMGWSDGCESMSPEEKRDIFKSLLRVVDVLASIHNVDLSIKENAKLLFVKSPN